MALKLKTDSKTLAKRVLTHVLKRMEQKRYTSNIILISVPWW